MQKWEYASIWVRSNVFGATFQIEYKERKYKDNEIMEVINDWGSRGWELVTVLHNNLGNRGTDASMLLFKRPIE